jgi:tetratricopeptide (TPR) repeat protein
MRSTLSLGVALALAVVCVARSALAEDAKALYQEGVAHFEAQRYAAASRAFRRAYDVKPSWKLLYNIGQSDAAGKRYGLALEAFEKYLVGGGDDVPEERREEVLAEIQRLRVLVGVIEVSGGDDLELFVDGNSRGTSPFTGPVRVAAGEHEVMLKRGGEVLVDQKMTVAGGMTSVIEEPSATEATPPPEEPTEEPGEPADDQGGVSGLLIAGIACGVAGLGGIALGAYGAARGSKDYDDYEKAGNAGQTAKVKDYEDNILPKDRALTGIGFGVGGALLATGVVLIIVDTMGDEDEDPAPVALSPAPGGLAITF